MYPLEMSWQTVHNGADCGIFTMQHMETYKGKPVKDWNCGLSNECDEKGEPLRKQKRQLNELRRKYVAKILLSDINVLRPQVELGVDKYSQWSQQDKREIEKTAFARINKKLGPTH